MLFRPMIDPNCPICRGIGFVCENIPTGPGEEFGCQCGAGEPCACNRSPEISQGTRSVTSTPLARTLM